MRLFKCLPLAFYLKNNGLTHVLVKFNVVENVNTTEPLSFVLNRIISLALSLSCSQSVHRVKDKSIRTLPVVPCCLALYLCAGLSF